MFEVSFSTIWEYQCRLQDYVDLCAQYYRQFLKLFPVVAMLLSNLFVETEAWWRSAFSNGRTGCHRSKS